MIVSNVGFVTQIWANKNGIDQKLVRVVITFTSVQLIKWIGKHFKQKRLNISIYLSSSWFTINLKRQVDIFVISGQKFFNTIAHA